MNTSKPPVDLNETQRDYALYLPAVSTFLNTYISKQRAGKYVPDSRLPLHFDRGVEGLNFLNQEEGYFKYNCGLYSAGHADLDLKKSQTSEIMFHSRDKKNTIIVGDSGGFQIGKGILKFDWHNFEGAEANKTRSSILNWLEETADWSMMLDIPGWAANEAHSPKTGLKTFEDCLEKTRFNNEFFLKNRQGKTKFLNVLQGTDWTRAEQWYAGMKEFSDPKIWKGKEAEGWAMGGANASRMDVTLKRLIMLREENLLQEKNWMHFLGMAQLDWSCFLTLIQRQIRQRINPNYTASFDCASPFVATAHGLVYTRSVHTNKKWTVCMEKAPDNKDLSSSKIPFPFESEIGRRLVMGDICHYAPGMLNKIGREGKTSWDSFSYALLMVHNTYMHIDAVQKANHYMDIETARVRHKVDWRHWRKCRANDTSDEYSDWVPRNILYFDRFVEELFDTKTVSDAFQLIEDAQPFLYAIESSRSQNGKARNNFAQLFDGTEPNQHNKDDSVFGMPELDEDALTELENSEFD